METKQLEPGHYSDAVYVEGVYRCDSKIECALHKLCRDYYEKTFHKVEVDDDGRKDIFQSSLLALWENIKCRRIYAEDGELKGKEGQPFISSLTTYFMGIVNNKYLEWLRKNPQTRPVKYSGKEDINEENSEEIVSDFIYDDNTIRKLTIIANRISHMAKQCNKILTLYYYEGKDYDEIMEVMPTFNSKDALKTAKYKCLKRLRESVTGTYC